MGQIGLRSLRRRWAALAALVASLLLFLALNGPLHQTAEADSGIHKIKHIVVIMQENRSFDSYFGTYPGADGIPANVCMPDPAARKCVRPYHDSGDKDGGAPHDATSAHGDIDHGRMDGFIKEAEIARSEKRARCNSSSTDP